MSRDVRLYLGDMESACARIGHWTSGRQLSLSGDDILFNAVLYQLQSLGEAAKQVPPDIRARAPDIPWAMIAGFRDVLAHAYFRVDSETVIDIVQNELPQLRESLLALIENLQSDPPGGAQP